jgi:hypothetical protein
MKLQAEREWAERQRVERKRAGREQVEWDTCKEQHMRRRIQTVSIAILVDTVSKPPEKLCVANPLGLVDP